MFHERSRMFHVKRRLWRCFNWQVQFDGQEERAGPCEFDRQRLIVCFLSVHCRESYVLHSMLIAAGRLSSIMNRTDDRINDSRWLQIVKDLLCVRCVCFVDLKSQLAAVPLSGFTRLLLFMTFLDSRSVCVSEHVINCWLGCLSLESDGPATGVILWVFVFLLSDHLVGQLWRAPAFLLLVSVKL